MGRFSALIGEGPTGHPRVSVCQRVLRKCMHFTGCHWYLNKAFFKGEKCGTGVMGQSQRRPDGAQPSAFTPELGRPGPAPRGEINRMSHSGAPAVRSQLKGSRCRPPARRTRTPALSRARASLMSRCPRKPAARGPAFLSASSCDSTMISKWKVFKTSKPALWRSCLVKTSEIM